MKTIMGTVEKGKRRGTALGYPTVNIPLSEPLSGVFAGRVKVQADEAPYMAAVFADNRRKVLEAHLLDFSDDLYGKEITVELHTKLRESRAFTDDGALRETIASDVRAVREYFRL